MNQPTIQIHEVSETALAAEFKTIVEDNKVEQEELRN